jgi:hypothetical protein
METDDNSMAEGREGNQGQEGQEVLTDGSETEAEDSESRESPAPSDLARSLEGHRPALQRIRRRQTPKSPNPAPPRPDLAGKMAGIFPIPIGPGSGKYSGFCPDPDWAGIPGNRGIPIWPGSGISRDLRLD